MKEKKKKKEKERNGHKESLQKGPRPHVKADHQIHILQSRYIRVHIPTEQPIIGFSGFVFKRRLHIVDIVIFKLLTPRTDAFFPFSAGRFVHKLGRETFVDFPTPSHTLQERNFCHWPACSKDNNKVLIRWCKMSVLSIFLVIFFPFQLTLPK